MTLTDEQIIQAVLTHPTNAEAAAALQISESYLYQRMRSESFKQGFNDAKSVIFATCLETAQRALSSSLITMAEIMQDTNNAPQVRLNAAQAIVATVTRLHRSAQQEREENSPFYIF